MKANKHIKISRELNRGALKEEEAALALNPPISFDLRRTLKHTLQRGPREEL